MPWKPRRRRPPSLVPKEIRAIRGKKVIPARDLPERRRRLAKLATDADLSTVTAK